MHKEIGSFITRHSKKFKPGKELTESNEYPGLTNPGGVELAQKTAREELRPMIDNLPRDAVVAIMAASDAIRTKSTAEIYGDELAKVYQGSDSVVVKKKKDIVDPQKGYNNIVNKLTQEIRKHQDKKIVIDFPLFIKELSMLSRWTDDEGNLTPYANKLLEISNYDENEAVINWVKTQGKIDELEGPKPEDVAKQYERGFKRLKEFCQKQVGDRPVVVGGAGHSWEIDVFVAYMTHGKVDEKSVQKIMGEDRQMIKETEPFYFKIEDDKIESSYRGIDYSLDIKDKE